VEAVLKVTDDVYGVFMRASAIDAMRKKGEFDDVLITMRRLVNIIPPGFEPFPFKPVGKHETALFQAFSSIRDSFSSCISTGGYAKALQLIAGLKPYVDDFFDNVMVMHEDEAVRNRRLSLLKVIADELTKLADFSKLGMGGGVL
jgi:glycyl-tRNA synthetase beta chain